MSRPARAPSCGWMRPRPPAHVLAAWIRAQPVTWSWFVTLTFRTPASEERAIRAWRRWAREVAVRMPWSARSRRRDHVPWVSAIERHSVVEGYHVHALVGGVDALDRAELLRAWRHGRAEVSAFIPGLGGLEYVLKDAGRGALVLWSDEVFTQSHIHR